MIDPWTPEQENHSSLYARFRGRLHKVPSIFLVHVPLGYNLTDQNGISTLLDRLADQLFIENLAAKVVDLKPGLPLQPAVPGIAFHVPDRIDAHPIRISPAPTSQDHHPSPDLL